MHTGIHCAVVKVVMIMITTACTAAWRLGSHLLKHGVYNLFVVEKTWLLTSAFKVSYSGGFNCSFQMICNFHCTATNLWPSVQINWEVADWSRQLSG